MVMVFLLLQSHIHQQMMYMEQVGVVHPAIKPKQRLKTKSPVNKNADTVISTAGDLYKPQI